MTIGSQTARAKLVQGQNPKVYNKVVATANIEVSQVLSSSTKSFIIRVRGDAELKLSFVIGESGTKYFTLPKGTSLAQDAIDFSGTLYFQTNKAAQVVEILEWT